MGAIQSFESQHSSTSGNGASRVRQRLSEAGAVGEGGVVEPEIDSSLAALYRLPVGVVRYDLWRAFLSVANSFAVTERELVNILESSRIADTEAKQRSLSTLFQFFRSRNEDEPSQEAAASSVGQADAAGDDQSVDFLEVAAVALFLAAGSVYDKVDTMCDWLELCSDADPPIVSKDMFQLCYKSVDAGLSKCLGCKGVGDKDCLTISERVWQGMCGASHARNPDMLLLSEFKEYCALRNGIVRRELEGFGTLQLQRLDVHNNLQSLETDVVLEEPSAGDEFMAVKPWLGALVPPTNPPPASTTPPVEGLSLSFVHGYRGFDTRDNLYYCNNNNINNPQSRELVYHTACLGVVMRAEPDESGRRQQRYYALHTNDIVSLAQHQGSLIATGDIGATPEIHIWNPQSMQMRFICKGFHKRGIAQLAFSEDGSLLLSIGLDDNHSVAIYDCGSANGGKLCCCAKGGNSPNLFAFADTLGDSCPAFVTGGKRFIDVWTYANRTVSRYRVKLGKISTTFVCGAKTAPGTYVFGTVEGKLVSVTLQLSKSGVSGNTIKSVTDGVAVTAIAPIGSTGAFLCGSKEGKLLRWHANADSLTPINQENMRIASSVQSVHVAESGTAGMMTVLVGTQRCEIFECLVRDAPNVAVTPVGEQPIMLAHFKDEVWGLATHPRLNQYCTCGDDATLRVWELQPPRLKCMQNIGGPARACAYHPEGTMVAVGFGGRIGRSSSNRQLDGTIRVYDSQQLKLLYEAKHLKKWVSDVKFSPNGSLLAAGSHCNTIVVYSITQNMARVAQFKKHSSYITHLDFSADGNYIQSNCGGYELLYSEASTGKQITAATKLRDTTWATWTCVLGWPVQGIWPACSDGTDINAVDRSHSGHLLATADDFGKVKLFRYPCLEKGALCTEYLGHSSHVTNVRWSHDDRFLLTTGGNDKSVFVWEGSAQAGSSAQPAGTDGDESPAAEPFAFDEFPGGGDEFMAVKPWLGAIVSPAAYVQPKKAEFAAVESSIAEFARMLESPRTPTQDLRQLARTVQTRVAEAGYSNPSSPDSSELVLDWVFGYRGFDCRNNVAYCEDTASIVYHTAALGIKLTNGGARSANQQYFRGHADDIMAFAVTADGKVAASAERGRHPKIFVWDTSSMQVLAELAGFHERGVRVLKFSRQGRFLLSVGDDEMHSVAVYDWRSGNLLCSQKGHPNTLDATFSGNDNEQTFVTCGTKAIVRWKWNGKNLVSKKITQGKVRAEFWSVAGCDGMFVLGANDGELYSFSAEATQLSAHPKFSWAQLGAGSKRPNNNTPTARVPVYCLSASTLVPEVELLVAGRKDGAIAVWKLEQGKQPACLHSWVLHRPSLLGSLVATPGGRSAVELPTAGRAAIRSVSLRQFGAADNFHLLVGTQECDIVQLDASSSAVQTLMTGHFKDELWGLSVHPSLPKFCTVGDDHTLRVWDLHTRQLIGFTKLPGMARACAYRCSTASNDDASSGVELIAVGFGGRVGRGRQKVDGMLRVYSESVDEQGQIQFDVLCETKDCKQWISELKFSPRGDTLAVGSHDNAVVIYAVRVNNARHCTLTRISRFARHNSYITHLDFSADGNYIQSNCGGYELLYSEASTGKQITAAAKLRDTTWATWTCVLGWPVQGIWPACSDGTDINAVDRSHSGHLLATADDFGKVKLFRYPCLEKGALCTEYLGHSSHVTNVRWSHDDRFLLTTGGNDKAVFLWRHHITVLEHSAVMSSSTLECKERELEPPDGFDQMMLDAPSGGDEFMAVKPWLGAIRAPTELVNPINPSLPAEKLALSWVFGYRGFDTRTSTALQNLWYTHDLSVVYPVAAVVAELTCNENENVLPSSEFEQKLLHGHSDDIICLHVSPDRRFIATGEQGRTAKICIWDAVQGNKLADIPSAHRRGVCCLRFSATSDMLVSVGMDDDHMHTVWHDVGGYWSKPMVKGTSKGDRQQVNFALWLQGTKAATFVSGGNRHLTLWTADQGKLHTKKGRFGKQQQQYLLSAVQFRLDGQSGDILTGCESGDVCVWNSEGQCLATWSQAHAAAIRSMCVLSMDTARGKRELLFTAGDDGKVKLWKGNSRETASVLDLANAEAFDARSPPLAQHKPAIRSLDVMQTASSVFILVGTAGCNVIQYIATIHSGAEASLIDISEQGKASVLMQGHSNGEVWGLAPHPQANHIVATAGGDGTLRIWNLQHHVLQAAVQYPRPLRCVAWGPDNTLAIGFEGSSKGPAKASSKSKPANSICFLSLECDDHLQELDSPMQVSEICGLATTRYTVSDLKFSPSGDLLAAGSHDPKKRIEFFSVTPQAQQSALEGLNRIVNKHSSYITHLDFSADGNYLQSSCGAYELLFTDVQTGKQITSASKLRDETWATWTCVLGWPVQGIWPASSDGTDINAVDRSHSGHLLATADDFGKVKLFRYPCAATDAEAHEYSGHSAHVTNIRWTESDEFVVSVGGNDKAVFVWRLA